MNADLLKYANERLELLPALEAEAWKELQAAQKILSETPEGKAVEQARSKWNALDVERRTLQIMRAIG